MNSAEYNPVLCMQHCTNQFNIFFTNFPEFCPICELSLRSCSLLIPPFRLPSPFVSNISAPCSVLVKPTDGTFLRDYKNGDDLHVGVSASEGTVYNYDERGLHCDMIGWNQCVAVNIATRICDVDKNWDTSLKAMLASGVWSLDRYMANDNNCYDFVLSFLNQLVKHNGEHLTKQNFCRNYVVPVTTKAAKYIHLYRKVAHSGITVEKCTL